MCLCSYSQFTKGMNETLKLPANAIDFAIFAGVSKLVFLPIELGCEEVTFAL